MKNKVLTALSVLLGLMFINSGLNKFLNYLPVPDGLPEEVVKDNNAIAEIVWLLPLIGSIEII
jgi:putative oxidoreductase